MYKIKLAACVATTLFTFLTLIPSFGDTMVGTGTVQTVSSNDNNHGSVGKVSSVSGPPDTTINQRSSPIETIPSISTAASAPRPTVVKKINIYKTYVYPDHRGHAGVYKEIESWHPVNDKFVDARDQNTLKAARKYTNKRLREHVNTQHQAMPNLQQPSLFDQMGMMGIGVNDISWIAVIVLVLYLLWHYCTGFRNWLTNLIHRLSPKPKPTLTNTAGGRFRKRLLPSSTIKCFEGEGKLVEIQKAVKDLDGQNTTWQWAPADGQLDFSHTPGGRLRFLVSFVNWSSREIPATPGMVIADLFESKDYQAVPGSGRIFIGEKELGKLDDIFIHRLISGNDISLSEIIDALPARTSTSVGRLNIVYEVDEVDGLSMLGGGDVPDESPSTGQMFKLHPETEGRQPEPSTVTPQPAPEGTQEPQPAAEPEVATAEEITEAIRRA